MGEPMFYGVIVLPYPEEWKFSNLVLTVIALVVLLVIARSVLAAICIPIPDDIADRRKLQCFDVMLRITNEFCGDFVQFTLGAKMRNRLTRQLISIPYALQLPPPDTISIRNEMVGGVAVRVYRPNVRKSNALILFVHGGGWATMRPVYYDAEMCALIKRLGILIISVDYRRSPEFPYPVPLLDCECVYQQLVKHEYPRFGIDPEKICIMGDSAGGNMSTVLVQRQLHTGFQQPKCQILIYPVIHAFDFQSPSHQIFNHRFRKTGLLNPRMLARWSLLYLGIPATEKNTMKMCNNMHIRRKFKENTTVGSLLSHNQLPAGFIGDDYQKPSQHDPDSELCRLFDANGYDPNFAPILGENLLGLSPAMVVTAGYDILRDEGALYVNRLRSFDVPVEWKHYEKAYHGVFNMPYSKQRREILKDIVQYLHQQLIS